MAEYIDKNKAIELIKELENIKDVSEAEEWVDIFITTINELPMVVIEAEPKHGKWEMYGAITRGTLAIPIYRCSECKEDTNNWFWHYCPHCGAKMDGGENG